MKNRAGVKILPDGLSVKDVRCLTLLSHCAVPQFEFRVNSGSHSTTTLAILGRDRQGSEGRNGSIEAKTVPVEAAMELTGQRGESKGCRVEGWGELGGGRGPGRWGIGL